MPDPGHQRIFLLPERRRFSAQALSPSVARLLGRADRIASTTAGERSQLLRHFQLLPRGWPMAAISRQADAGDAAQYAWLRADPVYVQPDMSGARLMAWGNLGLSGAEAEDLLQSLRPLFGDAGFPLSATPAAPDRWYLMLPRESPLPEFTTPMDGLGEDLLAHLPEGPQGRRWRALLNEAQVTLHNHPLNVRRIDSGLVPVNSLWFWGGGVLPDAVTCVAGSVISEDDELRALAVLAGASLTQLAGGCTLIDLRRERDWPALEREHLGPALADLKRHRGSVILDFADGAGWRVGPGQRWRLWRRSLGSLQS